MPKAKAKEPSPRRLPNKTDRGDLLLIIIISAICIITIRVLDSEEKYEPTATGFIEYRVAYGDTYWSIARQLQEKGYKKDIRRIVDELIEMSGIRPEDLKENDIIVIPKLEGKAK